MSNNKTGLRHAMLNSDTLAGEFCEILTLDSIFGDLVQCEGGLPMPFEANVPDPSTGEMLGVAEGVGGLTEGASTSILVPDYQGVYAEVLANNPAWEGGRVVTNYCEAPNDVSDPFFSMAGITVALDGKTVTVTGQYGGIGIPLSAMQSLFGPNDWCILSFTAKSISGETDLFIYYRDSAQHTVPITISTDEKWYALKFQYDASGPLASVTQLLQQRTADNLAVFEIGNIMIERVAASGTVGDFIDYGSKCYARESLNTIDGDRVVIPEIGAWIDPLPRLVYAPEKTNLEQYARDLTSNTNLSGLTDSFGALGIDQAPSATTLTDNDAAQAGYIRIQTTVVPGVKFYTTLFYIEKKTDAVYFRVSQQMRGGTSITARSITVRYSDLNIIEDTASNFDDFAVELIGDFIRVAVVQEDNPGDNNAIRNQIYPFYSTDGTNPDVTLTGSAVVDGVEVVESSSLISAEAQLKNPPVFTAGAPVTRTARALSFDIANHNNEVGGYYIELTLPVSQLPALRFEALSTTYTYSLAYVHNYGGTFYTTDTDGAVGIAIPSFAADATLRLGVIYSVDEDRKMTLVDGAESPEDNAGGYTLADKLMLCRIGSVCAKVGPIRRYEGTFDEMKAQLEADIAAGEAA